MVSCSEEGVVFIQSKSISENKWKAKDSIVFDFEIKDTLSFYDFHTIIRTTEDYRWSNLYLFSDLTFPNGKKRRDTIEIVLADQYGYWLGSNSGSFITTSSLFLQHRKFPNSGKYSLALTHGMREETINEVSDVGIKIKQWKESE